MDNSLAAEGLPPLGEIITALQSNPLYLDEAIPDEEAASITLHTKGTLAKFRCKGGGPPFQKQGRKVTYTRRGCLEYLRARQRRSTSDRSRAA